MKSGLNSVKELTGFSSHILQPTGFGYANTHYEVQGTNDLKNNEALVVISFYLLMQRASFIYCSFVINQIKLLELKSTLQCKLTYDISKSDLIFLLTMESNVYIMFTVCPVDQLKSLRRESLSILIICWRPRNVQFIPRRSQNTSRHTAVWFPIKLGQKFSITAVVIEEFYCTRRYYVVIGNK